MAFIHNDAKTLRFALDLVDRETLPPVPGQKAPPKESLRIIGTTAVEYLDRRDAAFWPFLRLPVLYLAGTDPAALVQGLRDVCSLARPGLAFRTGAQDELALQLAPQPGGGFIVEIGIDLAAWLHETSGFQGESGRELALFRFTTGTSELVVFADQLKQEQGKLL